MELLPHAHPQGSINNNDPPDTYKHCISVANNNHYVSLLHRNTYMSSYEVESCDMAIAVDEKKLNSDKFTWSTSLLAQGRDCVTFSSHDS